MFSFAIARPRRRPGLTPMIDVVFLLLVFFMLASRFGQDRALPLSAGGGTTLYSGPPRLVDIGAEDLQLNGVAVSLDALAREIGRLTASGDDMIVLRGTGDTPLQRLIDVARRLERAGFSHLAVAE
ncbi:hypothetical protein GCM10007928_01280 [Sulfitobacter porphyrae]|nr:hypothetical protein GCM10007928_01280 [Sulfitobacter porphyrae]